MIKEMNEFLERIVDLTYKYQDTDRLDDFLEDLFYILRSYLTLKKD